MQPTGEVRLLLIVRDDPQDAVGELLRVGVLQKDGQGLASVVGAADRDATWEYERLIAAAADPDWLAQALPDHHRRQAL